MSKIEIIDLEQTFNEDIEPRYAHTSTFDGINKLFVFGGISLDGKTIFNNIEILEYNTTSETFRIEKSIKPDKNLISPRSFHSTVFDENSGNLFIFGGKGNGYLNDLIIFSTKTHRIVVKKGKDMKGKVPNPRYGHGGCFIDGKLWIFGGYDNRGYDNNDFFSYSIEKNEWKRYLPKKGKLPRRYLFAHLFNKKEKKWIIVNGLSKSKDLSDIWEIDFSEKIEKKNLKEENEFPYPIIQIKVKTKAIKKEKDQKNYGQVIFKANEKDIYLYGRRDKKQSIYKLKELKENSFEWKKVDFPFTNNSFHAYGTINKIGSKLFFFGGMKVEAKENKEDDEQKVIIQLHQKLPNDCIKEILSYLSIKEIIKISEVSKTWDFSINANSDFFWKPRYEKMMKTNFEILSKNIKKKVEKEKNYKRKIIVAWQSLVINSSKLKKRCVQLLPKSFYHYNDAFNPLLLLKNKEKKNKIERRSNGYYYNTSPKISKVDILNSMKPKNQRKFVYGLNDCDCKSVIVGDGATGKTCFFISWASGKFPDDYVPTVYDNYNHNMKVGSYKEKWSLWDTAGEEDYDRLRPLSYPDTTAFVLSYSTVDPVSFQNIEQRWLPELREHCCGTPILLIGTKVDLKEDPRIIRELKRRNEEPVKDVDVKKLLAKSHDIMFWIENSAKTRKNLDLSMQLLALMGIVSGEGIQNYMQHENQKCGIQ